MHRKLGIRRKPGRRPWTCVVEGPIDDANSDDIGKTLDVRIRGGQAYTASLRVPIILIVIGLWIAVMGVLLAVKIGQPTGRAGRQEPPGPAGAES